VKLDQRVLPKLKRIVIKVGSSLLTEGKKSGIQQPFLRSLANQILSLQHMGIDSIVVTSGAIAAGMHGLNLKKRPKEIPRLQALAAVGQSNLMHAYETHFKKKTLKVAQILLTQEDLSDRVRYTNAHNTFLELLRHKIIPVVNENDTVAVEEIKFGDNDTLAMLVCHWTESDLLLILTDTEGFYEEDPRKFPGARLISEVTTWDEKYEAGATGSLSRVGTGGMVTKILAAKRMMLSGIPMVIANGRKKKTITDICQGKPVGTYFHPVSKKMNSRKRWLAWCVKAKGEVWIDEGASQALIELHKSLLPSGVKSLKGFWNKGDVIKVKNHKGLEIAQGLSNFASSDLDKIKGLKSTEIRKILIGSNASDELIHRDNLVPLYSNPAIDS
jgi:glutamate 5-kinase